VETPRPEPFFTRGVCYIGGVSLYKRHGKRALDLALGSIAFAAAAPVMALAAIAIKLDSPGPVFHRAVRCGRGGRTFTFLKLRSMRVGAEELSRSPAPSESGGGSRLQAPQRPARDARRALAPKAEASTSCRSSFTCSAVT